MSKSASFWMLPLRWVLFIAFQALIALFFLILGKDTPWRLSEGYWIITGLLANGVTFYLLYRLYQQEGIRYFDNFRFVKEGWWKDLLIAIGLLAVSGPITMYPNTFLAEHLLGSVEASTELFFRPLPLWVILLGFLWALTQGLVELPAYFAYIMPRLGKQLNNGWLAWALASFFLAFQHTAIPLIFQADFILWRLGMFLPFAFFIGLCLKLRPRLFPYLMTGHALMDIGAVVMLFGVR